MKIKFTIALKIILINLLFTLSAISSKGQTITSENFDGVIMPALPATWTTTFNFNIGWRTDSTNVSTGYANASGLNNTLVRNSDSSGSYTLYSPMITTTNYSNITVLFATRVSSNFTTSGSTTPQFEYTVDGGSTWSNISYSDNQANSIWDWVNGGLRIALNANANDQAAIQFRWTVNIVTDPQGTYRIDDFNVEGTNTSGINELIKDKDFKIFPNPATDVFEVKVNSTLDNLPCEIQITDLTGKICKVDKISSFPVLLSRGNLSNGTYILRVLENGTRSYLQLLNLN
jgi:hypothetical protein